MARASFAIFALVLAGAVHADPAAPVFSHKQHLGRGLECANCHDASASSSAPVIHLETACNACHQESAPEHQPLPKIRQLDVTFPHRLHAQKLACETCHAAVAEDRQAPGPVMAQVDCASCHAEKSAVSANACAVCHGEDKRFVRPASHGPLWKKTHGAEAQWQAGEGEHGQDCNQCHSKSSCTACHDQMLPTDHTGLWRMQAHGAAAAWDRDRCKTCHETSTCVRCHKTTEPVNHAGPWLQTHGLAAGSRVSESCAVCHQPAWCASCHATFTGQRR